MDISPSPSMDSIRPDEEAILVHAPAAPEVPQEDLLDVAAKFGLPVSSGQPLNTKLAATIDYLTNHQLQEEVLAKAMERHKAPGNCNSLNVPIVNMPIWGNISPGIQSAGSETAEDFKTTYGWDHRFCKVGRWG